MPSLQQERHIIIMNLKVIAGALVILVIAAMLSGCSHTTKGRLFSLSANHQFTDSCNRRLTDTALLMLRTGDIALRRGVGADSYLLALLNQKDKTYSHCGIVITEHGYPFVYHSIGGEDNPDERLRRDSASVFFSSKHNTAIGIIRYNYKEGNTDSLIKIVYQYYARRPRFDMKFDLSTDDQLYCTEFIYKVVNKATGDSTYIGTSSLSGSKFVSTDNIFVNPHAQVIWQTKFMRYLYSQK